MNHIALHARPIEDFPVDGEWELKVLIDGRDLVELVESACGDGGYCGLWPESALPPSMLWLPREEWPIPPEWRVSRQQASELDGHFFPDGRVAVLCCSCTVIGCGAIAARISAAEGRVVWSDFDQARGGLPVGRSGRFAPGHEWRQDRLASLVFDRQYLGALAAAAQEWERLRPPA